MEIKFRNYIINLYYDPLGIYGIGFNIYKTSLDPVTAGHVIADYMKAIICE